MLDIRLIREQPDFVKAELGRSGVDPAEIDRLLDCDARRRKLQHELDEMRARRTRESKQLGKASPEERDKRRAEMRALGDSIAAGERDLSALERDFSEMMLGIRKIPRSEVPTGAGEADNRVIKTVGTPHEFTSFEPIPHWDIAVRLGVIDFDRGVKLAGTRFYVMIGALARLQRALITWMLDLKREQGYLEMLPPLMVNSATATSTGHLPRNADTMYRDIEEDFWFIPTAEVPLTALYRDEILDEDKLPIYLTAYTPCFRREKMSAGRDVRGIKRGHQFDKVEMVKLVRPETSDEEFHRMVANAEEICAKLEIPYRVVQLCTGDLSFASAITYDLEMWAPGCGEWLEVSSVSNCTDFQARRAQIRFRPKGGKPEFLHTLNGSGLALPRTMIAIMENYQNEDGSITIPQILRPYVGGMERISGAR
jgi:seryl-tRNA synthetase